MSYLNNTRLVFSGTFQADVSTVNNDVRHYDNASFEQRFQERAQPGGPENGSWNPVGSGAFRLIGCHISSVHYMDGTATSDQLVDSAVGLTLAGANERVAAKLVDLDPQWQLASQIWGLQINLAPAGQPPLVSGRFLTTALRDMNLHRVFKGMSDGAASSNFQSVLVDVDWHDAANKSRALNELRTVANSGQLSVRLMTFAYCGRHDDPRFSLGTVCGVIGPALQHEPGSFVLGRRFVAADATGDGQSALGIGYFSAVIDEGSATLLLDLGNALRLSDTTGTVMDIGKLTVGVLLDPALPEGVAVTAANFLPIDEIAYRSPRWLLDTSGIVGMHLSASQLASARDKPLALVVERQPGTHIIAIRESADGLSCCAEEFVQRIDAPGKSTVTIHAAKFGQPLANANIVLAAVPPQKGVGAPNTPGQPKAQVPLIGVPPECLRFPPKVATDQSGRATVALEAAPPLNPRGYIDGQIYRIRYAIEGEAANGHHLFDRIVVHVRDRFDVPDEPAWIPHIAPILTQYGNLYPIMSRRLIDFSDPQAVLRNLKILQLAFATQIDDPNYMPVTRDLSANKRTAIQRWLARLATKGDPTFVGGPQTPGTAADVPAAPDADPATAAAEPLGGKTTFALGLSAQQKD